jgi:hypothetical protein
MLVSLCHVCYPPSLRRGFRLDVRLICLSRVSPTRGAYVRRHASLSLTRFPPFLREGVRVQASLSLSVIVFPSLPTTGAYVRREASLCHACFPPSLRDELRLDVSLFSLCHAYFPPSLGEVLRLDVRLVCLWDNMPFAAKNTSGEFITVNSLIFFLLFFFFCFYC